MQGSHINTDLPERLRVAARTVRNSTGTFGRDEDADRAVAELMDEAANRVIVQDREIDAALLRNMKLVDELDALARTLKALKSRNMTLAVRLQEANA